MTKYLLLTFCVFILNCSIEESIIDKSSMTNSIYNNELGIDVNSFDIMIGEKIGTFIDAAIKDGYNEANIKLEKLKTNLKAMDANSPLEAIVSQVAKDLNITEQIASDYFSVLQNESDYFLAPDSKDRIMMSLHSYAIKRSHINTSRGVSTQVSSWLGARKECTFWGLASGVADTVVAGVVGGIASVTVVRCRGRCRWDSSRI